MSHVLNNLAGIDRRSWILLLHLAHLDVEICRKTGLRLIENYITVRPIQKTDRSIPAKN